MTFSFADGSTNSPVTVNAPAGNGNLYQNPQLVPFAPRISTKINALVLSANTAQAFTVPAGFTKAFISCDTPGAAVWMAYNKAAVIPTGNITNGSCPMLNTEPACLKRKSFLDSKAKYCEWQQQSSSSALNPSCTYKQVILQLNCALLIASDSYM